jgi:predicted nucleic acid-binding Zn ribbon protein
MTKMNLLAALAVSATLGGTIAACGVTTDADKGVRDTGSALGIVNMPNHFNNVAVKCFKGNGIYVTNNDGTGGNGSSLAVVTKDPLCVGQETTR